MRKRLLSALLCITVLTVTGCSTGSGAPIAQNDYMSNIALFGNKEGGESYAVGSAKTAEDDAAAQAEKDTQKDKESPESKEGGFGGIGNPFAKGGVQHMPIFVKSQESENSERFFSTPNGFYITWNESETLNHVDVKTGETTGLTKHRSEGGWVVNAGDWFFFFKVGSDPATGAETYCAAYNAKSKLEVPVQSFGEEGEYVQLVSAWGDKFYAWTRIKATREMRFYEIDPAKAREGQMLAVTRLDVPAEEMKQRGWDELSFLIADNKLYYGCYSERNFWLEYYDLKAKTFVEAEKIKMNEVEVDFFIVENGFVSSTENGIYHTTFDLQTQTCIESDFNAYYNTLFTDGKTIYAAEFSPDTGNHRSFRMDLDGSNRVEVELSFGERFDVLDACDGWIYFNSDEGLRLIKIEGDKVTQQIKVLPPQ